MNEPIDAVYKRVLEHSNCRLEPLLRRLMLARAVRRMLLRIVYDPGAARRPKHNTVGPALFSRVRERKICSVFGADQGVGISPTAIALDEDRLVSLTDRVPVVSPEPPDNFRFELPQTVLARRIFAVKRSLFRFAQLIDVVIEN